jgi:hypothetical protein
LKESETSFRGAVNLLPAGTVTGRIPQIAKADSPNGVFFRSLGAILLGHSHDSFNFEAPWRFQLSLAQSNDFGTKLMWIHELHSRRRRESFRACSQSFD